MDSPLSVRPTYARIDLGAIATNCRRLQDLVGGGVGLLAVVKADAYGHGALPVARCLVGCGVRMLGVAIAEEGIALRRAGIALPILVLGQVLPEQVLPLVEREIRITVSDLALAEACSQAARRSGKIAHIHIKIDTGMGRLGILAEEAIDTVLRIARLPGLQLEGLATHFSSAGEADPSFTDSQVETFRAVLDELRGAGIHFPWVHAANSAALLGRTDFLFNLVRPGLAIYGLSPAPTVVPPVRLQPALSLHSRVVLVKRLPAGWPISYGRTYRTRRPTTTAVLTIGYDDGYPRRLSNRGWVRIRGKLCPVVGRICMDQCVVDVTDLPGVRVGDEATLYEADRRSPISVERIAELVETVPHEVLCRIGRRVPRLYIDSTGTVDVDWCVGEGGESPLRRAAG